MPRKVNQIGIVVKDINKSIQFYQSLWEIDQIQVLERPPETCILRGRVTKFRLKTAFTMLDGIQIEFIQVMEGTSAHSEFLAERGEGVHHLAYYVTDIEAEIAQMAQKGVIVYAKGEFMGTKWAYLDTIATAGVFQEFIQLPQPRVRVKKGKG